MRSHVHLMVNVRFDTTVLGCGYLDLDTRSSRLVAISSLKFEYYSFKQSRLGARVRALNMWAGSSVG